MPRLSKKNRDRLDRSVLWACERLSATGSKYELHFSRPTKFAVTVSDLLVNSDTKLIDEFLDADERDRIRMVHNSLRRLEEATKVVKDHVQVSVLTKNRKGVIQRSRACYRPVDILNELANS